MEVHIGVIRDKPGIYTGLWRSRNAHQQLAVCYKSDDKLLVKICVVAEITGGQGGTMVSLESPEDETDLITIPFEAIESIYPIHNFVK